MESLDDPSLTDDPVVLIYETTDEPDFNRALDAIRDASIPCHAAALPHFLLSSTRLPEFKILIRQSDSERAGHALEEEFSGTLTQEDVSLPAQDSLDQSDDGKGTTPRVLPKEWDGTDATAEAWVGDDASFARMYRACLRENAIPTRTVHNDPGRIHIFVRPDDADRAHEILREITEGKPQS